MLRQFYLVITFALLAGCAAADYDTPAVNRAARAPETPQQQRERQCKAAAWGQLGAPSRSGTFGEGMSNVSAAYANCMAGLPVAPQQPAAQGYQPPKTIDCTPYNKTLGTYDGKPKPPDGYTCVEQ